MSKIRRPVAIAAATVALAAAGIGTGVAVASSNGGAARHTTPSGSAPASDGDNVQQGDQSTPDMPSGASDETDAPENDNGSEVGTSDGSGGHADPGGNVDHQFDGTE